MQAKIGTENHLHVFYEKTYFSLSPFILIYTAEDSLQFTQQRQQVDPVTIILDMSSSAYSAY